jgi:hypothetical protein
LGADRLEHVREGSQPELPGHRRDRHQVGVAIRFGSSKMTSTRFTPCDIRVTGRVSSESFAIRRRTPSLFRLGVFLGDVRAASTSAHRWIVV